MFYCPSAKWLPATCRGDGFMAQVTILVSWRAHANLGQRKLRPYCNEAGITRIPTNEMRHKYQVKRPRSSPPPRPPASAVAFTPLTHGQYPVILFRNRWPRFSGVRTRSVKTGASSEGVGGVKDR